MKSNYKRSITFPDAVPPETPIKKGVLVSNPFRCLIMFSIDAIIAFYHIWQTIQSSTTVRLVQNMRSN